MEPPRYVQIVRSSKDGVLEVTKENLQQVLGSWGSNVICIPLKFVAVTGGDAEWRKFFTKSLIKHYETDPKVLQLHSTATLIPNVGVTGNVTSNANKSGVYLWTKAYQQSSDQITGILVISATTEVETQAMEKFILLVCSHIVELVWINKKFQLVEHLSQLVTGHTKTTKFCNNITYILEISDFSFKQASHDNPNQNEESCLKMLWETWARNVHSMLQTLPYENVFNNSKISLIQNGTVLKYVMVCNAIKDIVGRVGTSAVITGSKGVHLCCENVGIFMESATEMLTRMMTQSGSLEGIKKDAEQSMPSCGSDLDVFNPICVTREVFESNFKDRYVAKLSTSLTYDNVSSLLDACYQEVIASFSGRDFSYTHHEFEILSKKVCEHVDGYVEGMKRYFKNLYVCFVDEKRLEYFTDKELRDVKKAMGSNEPSIVSYLVLETCKTLEKMYLVDNSVIKENEQHQSIKLAEEIRKFYNEEIRKQGSNKDVETFHQELVISCINVFRKQIDCIGKENGAVTDAESKLKSWLHDDFRKVVNKAPAISIANLNPIANPLGSLLSTLILRISKTHYIVGWVDQNGCIKFLRDKNNHRHFPTIVGEVNKKGKLSSSANPMLNCYELTSENIQTFINTLFKKVKKSLEYHSRKMGSFSSVIVVTQNWMQPDQVKELDLAANAAGFKTVKTVEENHCIANAFLTNNRIPLHQIGLLIISYNVQYVDVNFYEVGRQLNLSNLNAKHCQSVQEIQNCIIQFQKKYQHLTVIPVFGNCIGANDDLCANLSKTLALNTYNFTDGVLAVFVGASLVVTNAVLAEIQREPRIADIRQPSFVNSWETKVDPFMQNVKNIHGKVHQVKEFWDTASTSRRSETTQNIRRSPKLCKDEKSYHAFEFRHNLQTDPSKINPGTNLQDNPHHNKYDDLFEGSMQVHSNEQHRPNNDDHIVGLGDPSVAAKTVDHSNPLLYRKKVLVDLCNSLETSIQNIDSPALKDAVLEIVAESLSMNSKDSDTSVEKVEQQIKRMQRFRSQLNL